MKHFDLFTYGVVSVYSVPWKELISVIPLGGQQKPTITAKVCGKTHASVFCRRVPGQVVLGAELLHYYLNISLPLRRTIYQTKPQWFHQQERVIGSMAIARPSPIVGCTMVWGSCCHFLQHKRRDQRVMLNRIRTQLAACRHFPVRHCVKPANSAPLPSLKSLLRDTRALRRARKIMAEPRSRPLHPASIWEKVSTAKDYENSPGWSRLCCPPHPSAPPPHTHTHTDIWPGLESHWSWTCTLLFIDYLFHHQLQWLSTYVLSSLTLSCCTIFVKCTRWNVETHSYYVLHKWQWKKSISFSFCAIWWANSEQGCSGNSQLIVSDHFRGIKEEC